MEDFELYVKCASGQSLPYIGYAKVDIGVKDLFEEPLKTIAIVSHETDLSRSTPLVLGTNIIKAIKEKANRHNVAHERDTAFHAIQSSCIRFCENYKENCASADGK